jgi:hypothetical protein
MAISIKVTALCAQDSYFRTDIAVNIPDTPHVAVMVHVQGDLIGSQPVRTDVVRGGGHLLEEAR